MTGVCHGTLAILTGCAIIGAIWAACLFIERKIRVRAPTEK